VPVAIPATQPAPARQVPAATLPPTPAPKATRPAEPSPVDPPPVERPGAEAPPPTEPAAASASTPASTAGLEEIRASWATVVERASPVIKPLLKECRPIARDGARLTLAFPEGRDFMRSNIQRRAGQIEALLTDMFGGAFAVECVASNVELEPLTVEEAVGDASDDPEARALLEGVLKITGGELVDAPEVR
jgi:hypothetical protein